MNLAVMAFDCRDLSICPFLCLCHKRIIFLRARLPLSNSSNLAHPEILHSTTLRSPLSLPLLSTACTYYTAKPTHQQRTSNHGELYSQSLPPSIAIHTPVTKLASSLTKYSAAFATSSGMLIRPSGTVVLNRARSSSESGTPENSSRSPVGARRGHIEFTRMLWGPNSAARPWVI